MCLSNVNMPTIYSGSGGIQVGEVVYADLLSELFSSIILPLSA